jgi:uncharacterized protein (TIGR02246 family)
MPRCVNAVASTLVLVLIFLAAAGCQSTGGGNNSAASSSSAGGAGTEQQVNRLLDEYTQALLNKDTAALDRIWSDDLTFINPRGQRLTKQERIDNIKTGATAFRSIRLADQRVRVADSDADVAIATFNVSLEAQYSGQEGSGTYAVTAVLTRRNNTWQIAAIQMTKVVQ